MKAKLLIITAFVFALTGCARSVDTGQGKPVIFDTDWWTDVDDACAIRILCDAHQRGDVNLLGICLSAINGTSVQSLDAFLRHEGCPGVELGADKQATDFNGKPSYHQTIIDMCADPEVRSLDDCEDCVSFYRRLLSVSRSKVDIIAVGYPNALSRLLESTPDKYSRLNGEQLVRKKVRHLWMMAGNYPEGKENNFRRTERSRQAGHIICDKWPTDVTFLGFELGIQVVAGGKLPEDDVLHAALAAHGSAAGRYAWDPMTTLMAITGDPAAEGYDCVTGTNRVDASDGSNVFTASPEGRHRYVTLARDPQWFVDRLDSLLTD